MQLFSNMNTKHPLSITRDLAMSAQWRLYFLVNFWLINAFVQSPIECASKRSHGELPESSCGDPMGILHGVDNPPSITFNMRKHNCSDPTKYQFHHHNLILLFIK
jgi:hypothetical protein